MPRRRLHTTAPDAPRQVRDRAALFLEAQDGPVSSVLLAREVLGLHHGSESACAAILAPVLEGDPRVARTAEGRWILGEPAPGGSAMAESLLRERVWSVFAIEPGGRAAAAVRIERGRTTAERAEPSEEVEGETPVADAPLSRAAWRRLSALAAGALVTSWDRVIQVKDGFALGSSVAFGESMPSDKVLPPEAFISLSAIARAALGPPRPRSLERLAGELGVGFVEDASSLAQARLGAECLLFLLDREPLRHRGETGLRALLEARSAPHPGLDDPAGALRRDLDALPAEPGVYSFFDRRGQLLYVGKARDLRRRVGSYFTARTRPDPRTAAWLGSVDRIEHERSGSELEALLREASQIAARAPAKNRQRAVHARRGRAIGNFVLVQTAERTGAVRVALVKDGSLAARVVLGPRGGGCKRLRALVEEIYFPGIGGRRSPPKSSRTAMSETAFRALILSWLRTQRPGLPALDPTDDPGPDEACARILAQASALRKGETHVTFR